MPGDELGSEQRVLDLLYSRLDELRERTARDLRRTQGSTTAGTPAARTEQEAFVRLYAERLAALTAAEERLCFGRLDMRDGVVRHIGRIGLADDDQQVLLTDWRAPAAEPFYQATAAAPDGVARRRHILTERRRVTSLEDDVLDLDALGAEVDATSVQGGGTLMAALAAKRTGRMHDIVATIQAEQDRIIRSPLAGILVVEGAPGCGKTVVALHRAAFLLYAHRDRLARDGVLVVGPNPMFLRYISQVLPALGETSAVLATPGSLVPGIDATANDDDLAASIKGDLRMADVIATAVRRLQRIPDAPRTLDVGGTLITLTPQMAASAMDRARSSRKPHNEARRTFVVSLLDRLAAALASARGVDLESQRALLLEDLRDSKDVRREVNLCWMPTSPQRLVGRLWSRPELLSGCAPYLSRAEVALLQRDDPHAWTVSDVPLLDEAAELLGDDDEQERRDAALAKAERNAEYEYAQAVLEMTGTGDAMTADVLVNRYAADAARLSVAERAAGDRSWTYGHLVIDEAQELSAMTWRVLMRRCPSRSMTVVGDLDQRGSSAGPASWAEVFDAYAPPRPDGSARWHVESLTVNYRTPQPIMAVATEVAAANGLRPRPVTSARDGEAPVILRPSLPRDPAALCAAVELLGDGTSAVIVAVGDMRWAAETLASVDRPVTSDLDADLTVLTTAQAKGLEFDNVVVLEPAAMLADSPRGASDLYVAMTRATARLVIVDSAGVVA